MSLLTDDPHVRWLLLGVVAFLVLATGVGQVLARRATSPGARATVANVVDRTTAWWVMVAVFVLALALGTTGAIVLFGLLSFQALREFLSLTPTRTTDHGALLLAFFVAAPLQYWLLAVHWYGFFAIMIPVFAFLLLPARAAVSGDTGDFLARAATTQWGLVACVYCLSYVPAVLQLDVAGGTRATPSLLLWLVLVVQLSDVLQFAWGKTVGRRPVAPLVSPNKTWEGLVLGGACAVGVGAALWGATPFTPWAAAGLAAVVVVMGFLGGLVLSAIKRDRGIKDYGTLIRGHGGVLDRTDSLLFAAPVFFHLVRYWY